MTWQADYAFYQCGSLHTVLIGNNLKIHLPDHCLSDVEAIMYDDECVDAINAGKCGFKPTQYEDKNGKTRNSGNFIDI